MPGDIDAVRQDADDGVAPPRYHVAHPVIDDRSVRPDGGVAELDGERLHDIDQFPADAAVVVRRSENNRRVTCLRLARALTRLVPDRREGDHPARVHLLPDDVVVVEEEPLREGVEREGLVDAVAAAGTSRLEEQPVHGPALVWPHHAQTRARAVAQRVGDRK